MNSRAVRFALVAGETSGDLLAGLLLKGLRQRWPQLHAHGIGGPRMVQQGFAAQWPSDKLAVRGYVEVLRHYREIAGIRDQLTAQLLAHKPDLFIGVDAPDFNLTLEAALRRTGVKTVHFVCPAIWAWRADRVDKIHQSADHVLCIFPFEAPLLDSHGIAATYVGHPLANVIPLQPDQAAARRALGLQPQDRVLAILPGSRASEVHYLALRFFQAAAHVKRAYPAIKIIVPAIPALKLAIEIAAQAAGLGEALAPDGRGAAAVQILSGQSHTALAACDVTLIASGTATLEAALFKRPMVIAYNMNWLSWQIMQRKKLQPWVGLPNILCREFVVPELLQDAATPRALADAVLRWLSAWDGADTEQRCGPPDPVPAKIAALHQRFTALHHELLRDTSQLATDAIQKVLES